MNHINWLKKGKRNKDDLLAAVCKDSSGCWIWQLHKDRHGYGKTTKRLWGEHTAHRSAYAMFKGQIPDGMVVMHSCDNPSCVNPDHLSVGTIQDNVTDMIIKGRYRCPSIVGENNPRAKVTEDQVKQIRARAESGEPIVELSKAYCLHKTKIYDIVARRTWKHVE